jgi:hypothetical protein
MEHAGVRQNCNESGMLKKRLSLDLILPRRETQDKTSMLDPCTNPRQVIEWDIYKCMAYYDVQHNYHGLCLEFTVSFQQFVKVR